MALAIALSLTNVEQGGGPFAALVFVGSELVGAGVNRVLDSGFSIAHAEIVALMRAQRALRERAPARSPLVGPYSLVTTTEPCCQCFGALIWSGIEHLACGATRDDAESAGFDEGPKPDGWVSELQSRGMSVAQLVLRSQAAAVIADYVARGGIIYGRNRFGVPR